MNLHMVGLLVLMLCVAAVAQRTPRTNGKATEEVVKRYQELIADGALLTPDGWKRAAKLHDSSNPYPENGVILLTSTGGAVGEMWVKGDRAEVQTMWTDSFGRIDSALRYMPEHSDAVGTIYVFHLVRAKTESTGPREWKIEGPLRMRSATLDKAIEYVRRMREKSADPAIKKNADRTIAVLQNLKRERSCGSASAC